MNIIMKHAITSFSSVISYLYFRESRYFLQLFVLNIPNLYSSLKVRNRAKESNILSFQRDLTSEAHRAPCRFVLYIRFTENWPSVKGKDQAV